MPRPRPQDIQYANADGSLTRIDYANFLPRQWHRKRRVCRRQAKRAREEFCKAVRKFHQRTNPCGLPYVYGLDGYPQIVCDEPAYQATVRL
jgi:hypothetical protein